MQPKVYSHSLKKLKKQQVFDYTIQKIQKMEQQIQRSANSINAKQKPVKNYIMARKDFIQHKQSNNKLQQEVDKIMKNLVSQNKLLLNRHKINQKHNYNHYRIQTEPNENKLSQKKLKTVQNEEDLNDKILAVQQNKLPRIMKSASHAGFQKSKTRKLKTQHQIVQRLSSKTKNNHLEYINIDSAIRQYRAGMTSLIKGVYINPHNPYKY